MSEHGDNPSTRNTPGLYTGIACENTFDGQECDEGSTTLTTLSPMTSIDYPLLDMYGDVQCAQAQDDTMDITLDITTSTPTFDLDDVVIDRIDRELHGLPKDNYISKLIELTNSSEEAILYYREELSRRARKQPNGPTGIMKSRRKSNRQSAADKYACDCYTISQFLAHDITHLDDLYRQTTSISDQPTPKKSNPLYNEVGSLKETVAELKAELQTVKLYLTESSKQAEVRNTDFKNDISDIKNELSKCADVIHARMNCVTPDDKKTLADGLSVLASKIVKLESSRNNVNTDVASLKRTVQDNTTNISNMNDSDTASRNHHKVDIQQLRDTFQSEISSVTKSRVPKSDYDSAIKSLGARIQTVEHKVKHDNTDTIKTSLRTFSDAIGTKLETLCQTMKENFQNLAASREVSVTPKPINENTRSYTSTPRPSSFSLPSKQAPGNCITQPLACGTGNDTPITLPTPNASQRQPNSCTLLPQPTGDNSVISVAESTTIGNAIYSATRLIDIPHSVGTTSPQLQSLQNGYPPAAYSIPSTTSSSSTSTAPPPAASCPDETVEHRRQSRFVGVVRKKAKLYIVSGIDLESNEEGLHDFLTEVGVTFKTAKFISTRRTDCQVAQIVVSEDHSDVVESPDTWPDNITCKPWLRRSEMKARRRTTRSANNNGAEPWN